MNYPLEVLVCDNLENIYLAARYYYPKVRVQLCTNHVKEGIRRELKSRTTPEHEHFVKQIEFLFRKTHIRDYSSYARKLLKEHVENPVYQNILSRLANNHERLIRYLVERDVPSTTNLIELYNSHLEARLKSMKGFESFASAEIWLNAYVLNRRLSKFTDCSKKFKHLNKTCSLAHTAGDNVVKVSLIKNVGKF